MMYNIQWTIKKVVVILIKTICLDEENLNKALLKEPAEHLKAGNLVAFPTETVYGLGADGLNPEAVKKIFIAKSRPADNPLILHVNDLDMVKELVQIIPESGYKLMEKYWPGPMTLIMEKSLIVPDIITAGLDTVAIRMPNNKIALELINQVGRPLAAPSSNKSGSPSPTRAEHVIKDLSQDIDMVIDGGSTDIGLESTVIDLTGDIPMILRPGSITLEELRKVLPNIEEDKSLVDKNVVPKSPGQKYRHYAPKADMFIYKGSLDFMVGNINKDLRKYKNEGKKVAIVGSEESLGFYNHSLVFNLGTRKNLNNIGRNLFDILRKLDELDVDIILSETVESKGLGKAIMNRLEKASGGNIIEER